MLTGYLTTLPQDCLLSAGVLYYAKGGAYVPVGVTDGAPDFDAASDQAEIMFDNRAPSRLKGLTRVVGYQPLIKGTLKELGPTTSGRQLTLLEPGETEATVSGVTTVTTKSASTFFAPGDYIPEFRWIFERSGGGYACIYAPLAICRKWSVKGVDKKEAQIAFEIEAVGDPVNDFSLAPYAIELRSQLPTAAPTSPSQLMIQFNSLGGGTVGATMVQLYVKGINQVVGGGKCTKWDDAVNPNLGKHWRPSADFGGGAGADVAGDGAIIGQGLEIPYSAGLSSTLQIGHDDLTSDTSGALPSSGGLFPVGADRGAGITWGGFGRMRVNTTIFCVGELSDSDRMEISTNKGQDYTITALNSGNTTNLSDGIWDQSTGSKVMHYAQWCALTPNRTHSVAVPLYCRRYGRDIIVDQTFRGQTPLKSGQRLRTLVFDGGWAPSAATAVHLLYICTGRANAAQTKMLHDYVETWLGSANVWNDPRPNYFVLFGDSFQPGPVNIQKGQNGSPVLPNCAVSSVARSGDTVNYDQFIISQYFKDNDYSQRTRLIPAIGEWLNEVADSLSSTSTELARNYYWGDFLKSIPTSVHNIYYNFTYATGASRTINDPTITNDLIANVVAGGHGDGIVNVQNSLMYDAYHYNDVPGSEPAVLWDGSSGHPAAVLGQDYLMAFYRAMAYMGMGVDDSAIPMKIDPLVSHISLSAGTPTGSTTWTVKNRVGGTVGGRTLTFSSLDTGVATVNSATGVVTRVAAGRARIQVVTDLGGVGVLAVDVT